MKEAVKPNELQPQLLTLNAGLSNANSLRLLGVIISILLIWNGVCDFIFGYSAELSGDQYFSEEGIKVIQTANGRPHWLIMLAQTAGWLYPIYALMFYHWWVGMRKAGFWLATVPVLLLAYSLLMIGGIQHAGWAFLSVLEQAKAVVGSTDPQFFKLANEYIFEHMVIGDLTAVIALNTGAIWMAISILSGRTLYPRWYVFLSPLGILILTMFGGYFLPAPVAGYFIALFGTWLMLIPTIATTAWLWNKH